MASETRSEYPEEDIEIIELGDSTSAFINGFKCHIQEIEKFLKEDALKQFHEGVNRTFLWMSRKNHVLLAYITLCADAISLDKIRKDELSQQGINYKSLPAMKICRMGVHEDCCRRKIGQKMIAFAIGKALTMHEKTACRFITLDSKNDENIPPHLKPIHFYRACGFEVLKTKEKKNILHMFKDLLPIIKEKQKEALGFK